MDYESTPSLGGFLSILLIFLFIILGSRMAGAAPIEKSRARRIATGIVLGVFVLMMGILPLPSPFAFLVILFYALFCGIVIMRRGENRNRWLIGPLVVAWTVLAYIDYGTSIGFPLGSITRNEASAVGTLRRLTAAEDKFSDAIRTRPSDAATYGRFDDLRRKRLIDDDLDARMPHNGYVFGEVIDPYGRQFIFYAIPAHLPHPAPVWSRFLPVCSLYYNGWRHDETHGTGYRSFAVDESGTIRFASSPISGPVPREEIARWDSL